MNKTANTSWGGIADWYHEMLQAGDTYQEKVILPNLLRLLAPAKGERVLDIACGEGFFTRALRESGAEVVGADISPELIAIAKKLSPKGEYFTAPVEEMSFAADGTFEKAFCILSLQNMENIRRGVGETARVLARGGTFIIVLNHPCFRIPKRSSWGYDEKENTQYRRLDGYLSESKENIKIHPGEEARGGKGAETHSFHRPLQVWAKILANAGFVIARLEEWESHKKSQKGPRAEAEDRARKEFPLFLCIVAEKHDTNNANKIE